MVFATELKKLGLNDKEAAVYLTCLQLGPSAVQPIARKAKVVRATTYVILEALMEMGLVTRYKEGKKTLYAAEPPRQLTRLIEKEQEAVEQRKQDLNNLLPELQIIMKGADDRPTIRYFSGLEGLRAMRREMLMYSQTGDEWLNFTPTDHLGAVFVDKDEVFYYKSRIAKGINSKTLFTTKSPTLKKELFSKESLKLTERRFVPPENFPSTSGMTIYRDRIAIGNFTGKLGGVIVESDSMAHMMRQLFFLAWNSVDQSVLTDVLDK